MKPWAHQAYAHEECTKLLNSGSPQKAVVCSNTGGGKTRMMTDLMLSTGARVALYTHRKMLLSQTSAVLDEAGIDHAIRADGYEEDRGHRIQLCSTQTIASRVLRGGESVHSADLIIIDEAHVQGGPTMVAILERHPKAHVVGYTATPVGIAHMYDQIIQAGTTSEMRACGALVRAVHYGCPEIDMGSIQPGRSGEFSEGDLKKCWFPPVVFGNVLEHFRRLNPQEKPTILFAPGVAESMYLAQHFHEEGIPAAHISADCIWINGDVYEATQENRDMLSRMARNGEVAVTCNRFVLREGINWPFLAHLIFATPFGSICSYLQAGGRVLRNHPELEYVTCQDHGGNWWRHGSLNEDREWDLSDTANILRLERMERMRNKKEAQPITCFKCYRIRLSGAKCPWCGAMGQDRRRAVIQTSGKLKKMEIRAFRRRYIDTRDDVQRRWDNQYHRAKNSKKRMNFNQAEALYAMDNNWKWPPRTLANMPIEPRDWHESVVDMPPERLI